MKVAMIMENTARRWRPTPTPSSSKLFVMRTTRMWSRRNRWPAPGRRLSLPGQGDRREGTKLDARSSTGPTTRAKLCWSTSGRPGAGRAWASAHIKKMYEKFHAKGFEVVGISLDRDATARQVHGGQGAALDLPVPQGPADAEFYGISDSAAILDWPRW